MHVHYLLPKTPSQRCSVIVFSDGDRTAACIVLNLDCDDIMTVTIHRFSMILKQERQLMFHLHQPTIESLPKLSMDIATTFI